MSRFTLPESDENAVIPNNKMMFNGLWIPVKVKISQLQRIVAGTLAVLLGKSPNPTFILLSSGGNFERSSPFLSSYVMCHSHEVGP